MIDSAQMTLRVGEKKGCHFVVIPRLKQPKNNPNNDSLLLANYLILNNSVVETAEIEPAALYCFHLPVSPCAWSADAPAAACRAWTAHLRFYRRSCCTLGHACRANRRAPAKNSTSGPSAVAHYAVMRTLAFPKEHWARPS